jgi:hypothetical protein
MTKGMIGRVSNSTGVLVNNTLEEELEVEDEHEDDNNIDDVVNICDEEEDDDEDEDEDELLLDDEEEVAIEDELLLERATDEEEEMGAEGIEGAQKDAIESFKEEGMKESTTIESGIGAGERSITMGVSMTEIGAIFTSSATRISGGGFSTVGLILILDSMRFCACPSRMSPSRVQLYRFFFLS